MESRIQEASWQGSFALVATAQLLIQDVDLSHLRLKSLVSMANLVLNLRVFELRMGIERALSFHYLVV